jgi:ankyrin repeat protein
VVLGYKFNGANLDALNTRYLEAVAAGEAEQAAAYIDRGANINARFDDNGDTALLRATRNAASPEEREKWNKMALMLIGKKASLDLQDADGASALILSIKSRNLPLATALSDANADIAIEDRDGARAFRHAMNTADPRFVQLFEKPMMTMLRNISSSELAQKLRASNRDPDSVEPVSGETMLTFAASRTDQNTVAEAFLQAGADRDKPNRAGKTPQQIAEEHGNTEMLKLLKQTPRAEKRTDAKPLFTSTT